MYPALPSTRWLPTAEWMSGGGEPAGDPAFPVLVHPFSPGCGATAESTSCPLRGQELNLIHSGFPHPYLAPSAGCFPVEKLLVDSYSPCKALPECPLSPRIHPPYITLPRPALRAPLAPTTPSGGVPQVGLRQGRLAQGHSAPRDRAECLRTPVPPCHRRPSSHLPKAWM